MTIVPKKLLHDTLDELIKQQDANLKIEGIFDLILRCTSGDEDAGVEYLTIVDFGAELVEANGTWHVEEIYHKQQRHINTSL